MDGRAWKVMDSNGIGNVKTHAKAFGGVIEVSTSFPDVTHDSLEGD